MLFYDIEVYKFDSLIVLKDIDNNVVGKFWNNPERQFVEDPTGFEGLEDLVRDHVLVGYNNYFYDDYILTLMLLPQTSLQTIIKAANDKIISGQGTRFKVSSIIKSLDTMQQISVAHPSLKQIEGNMGRSIVESKIDFTIDRPLTPDERAETERYCEYDVESTIEIYKLRIKSYFDCKTSLINMLPEDDRWRADRWNTTTLSALILTGGEQSKEWQTLHGLDKYWRKVRGIPSEVWDMWESCTTPETIMGKGKSRTIKAFGNTIVFGLGGLHGAPDKPCRYTKCKHADVKSMYPSAICYLSALGDATGIYDDMRKERISIKKSDPVKAAALKLILNSVYGNFKNKYSTLFNPLASATVCIYGQIALFSLSRDLHEAGYKVININTDGVVYVDDQDLGDADERVCRAWESEFGGFELEHEFFDKWVQKDVNNYVAVEDTGKVTVKGGDVNKYESDSFFSNNNCRIVQIALVDALLYQKPIDMTLVENLDKPMLWQYVLKAGSTYKGVQDLNGDWQQNVNRVFAAKDGVPYTRLYKVRADDGLVNFPDVPERMYLWNGDVNDIEDFANKIDMSHYYELVKKKLEGWGVYRV